MCVCFGHICSEREAVCVWVGECVCVLVLAERERNTWMNRRQSVSMNMKDRERERAVKELLCGTCTFGVSFFFAAR